MKSAVFLDRDGTLIEDPGYLGNPDQVVLLPGVAGSIRRLNESDLAAIVVTNQSGIARGLVTEAGYEATTRRLDAMLKKGGARVDAHFHCPHLPEITGPCECRKPGSLLFRRAAEQFDLDLGRSWWVGDRLRDVEPAAALGGAGILLTREARDDDIAAASSRGWLTASDLPEAVERLILPRCH